MADTNITPEALGLAKEHEIDLATVTGTGTDGRITKPDVEAAVKAKEEAKAADLGGKAAAKQSEAPAEPTVEDVQGLLDELRGKFVIVGSINDGDASYGTGKENAFLDHLKAKLDKGQVKPKTLANSLRAHKQGGTIVLKKEEG